MGRIGLADALRLLREELGQAQDEGQGHQFRFEITEVEVEFLVEVDSQGGLNGKAGFGVVSVGASGKVSRADTHRLRLTLNVKDAVTGDRNLEVRRDEAGTLIPHRLRQGQLNGCDRQQIFHGAGEVPGEHELCWHRSVGGMIERVRKPVAISNHAG